MAYSCADFVDTILEALNVAVPPEAQDDPAAQADLTLGVIYSLREALYLAAEALTPPRNVAEGEALAKIRQAYRKIIA